MSEPASCASKNDIKLNTEQIMTRALPLHWSGALISDSIRQYIYLPRNEEVGAMRQAANGRITLVLKCAKLSILYSPGAYTSSTFNPQKLPYGSTHCPITQCNMEAATQRPM